MAKKATPASTPAQPWAAAKTTDTPAPTASTSATDGGAGNGGGTGEIPADAKVIQSTADVPNAEGPFPGQDTDDVDVGNTHLEAEKLAENDVASTGTKELPSFVRDQVSPSGIDIALEADRSERPSLDRSAYPSLGERLNQLLIGASDELKAQFEDRMAELGEQVIAEIRANDTSADMIDRMVDGTQHYGPRVRSAAAQKAVPTSGAEANRRARRAAERLAAQSKPR